MGIERKDRAGGRAPLTTTIARHDASGVNVRGHDLVRELVGEVSYTEMLYLLFCKRLPTERERIVLDACLVTLMEAGLNASSVVTRVTAAARPGQMQAAIAAGLLTVGERFVGSSQGCGDILAAAPADPDDLRRYCLDVAQAFRRDRKPVPGFGHGTHKDQDPRAVRLLEVADEAEIGAQQLNALRCLGVAVSDVFGRELVVNATGAIAALLLGVGLPPAALTGIAVVTRSGGLAAHALEEAETHTSDSLWQVFRETVVYEPDQAE